jgi:hypothetical protein
MALFWKYTDFIDLNNIGSFVKKLKAWGGLQSNDMNIDWTPKAKNLLTTGS